MNKETVKLKFIKDCKKNFKKYIYLKNIEI